MLVELPAAHREQFKEPLGPLFTDATALLAEAGTPLLTVGDVVTYHLLEASRPPDVGIVDGRTKRRSVDPTIGQRLSKTEAGEIAAGNPAGTITRSLVTALSTALERADPVLIDVDGEEDLATIPAILLAPTGASVVYGQPGEGMVHVQVDESTKKRARELLELMKGDHGAITAGLAR